MSFYEESGKSRHRSSSAPVERELEALSSLDRVTRTEMVHGKHPVHTPFSQPEVTVEFCTVYEEKPAHNAQV